MKKINLLLALCFFAGVVNAQNKRVIDAFNNLRKGNIEKAKIAIDEASEDAETKEVAKTWFYRGNIYLAIAASPDSEIASLDSLALDKAYEYYQKSINLDKEVSNDMLNVSSPFDGIRIIAVEWSRKGQIAYEKGDFYTAFSSYRKSHSYNPDKIAMYMAAISGFNYESNRNPKKDTLSIKAETKALFNELIKTKFPNEKIYECLSNMYMTENDTLKAISVVNKAEKEFSDSSNTLILKCNVLFWAGKTDDAAVVLQKLQAKAPDNPYVLFNIGTILEKSSFEESEKAYKKALDIKPDYFDAKFNLGALYFNKFVELKKKASKLKVDQQAEYDALIAESNSYLKKAQPIVEECYQMNAKDYGTVFMLKQIYANTKEMEKVKEMDVILKTLK